MKSITSILLALVCLSTACKNKSPESNPDTTTATDSSIQGRYLPVIDLIRNDIKHVDSFAGGILYKSNLNGKKDSAYIQLPGFHRLANQFLLAELDSASFQQHFTESSLMDEASQMLNFIYTAKEADWPLQKAIIYIKPGISTDQVNRIYMERTSSAGDTLVQQKMTWRIAGYFYILTIRQPKAGPTVTSMEKVIWDPQHFDDRES